MLVLTVLACRFVLAPSLEDVRGAYLLFGLNRAAA
jgi:hypothetical protein